MVERPIKKSERLAQAAAGEANPEIQPVVGQSDRAPAERRKPDTSRRREDGKGKGKGRESREEFSRPPANLALMRGPKPPRLPTAAELAAQEAAEAEAAAKKAAEAAELAEQEAAALAAQEAGETESPGEPEALAGVEAADLETSTVPADSSIGDPIVAEADGVAEAPEEAPAAVSVKEAVAEGV